MQEIKFDYHHTKHYKYQKQSKKTLIVSLILTLIFAFVELFGGIFSNSLALISDSFHMFSDVLALILSLVAIYFSLKKPTKKFTFGFLRVEILAAFLNGLALLLISIGIFVEGINRILSPENIDFSTMFFIALIGLFINIILTIILYKSLKEEENLNIKSALWHFLGDLLNSVGVIVGALIIKFTGFVLIDPILSIVISGIIFLGGYKIVKSSAMILLESIPDGYDIDEIRKKILEIKNVKDIHEFHLLSLSEGHLNLSFHVLLKDYKENNDYKTVDEITKMLEKEFKICHVTIQIENPEINIHK